MIEGSYEHVVLQLNEMLDEYTDQRHSFYHYTNGFTAAILFDDVVLWDSENDMREWNEEEKEYEPLFEHCKEQFENYVFRLVRITKDKELIENINHIHKDLRMLQSGDWVPDEHSCTESMGVVEEIADKLNIEIDYE